MWLILAFLSALFLGFYDVSKKQALKTRAVIPVLFLNTLFCSLIFLPAVICSYCGMIGEESTFFVPSTTWGEQKYIFLKACIVLSSWICGYYGMKWLPLTIVGPINATRPVMVLIGALLVFGERLNIWQWIGVILAIVSFFMLARTGKREGIDFRHNRWIVLIVLAAVLGAVSGLYDKYLMAPSESGGVGLNRMAVQSYYNIYQSLMMGVVLVCDMRYNKNRESSSAGAPDRVLASESTGTYTSESQGLKPVSSSSLVPERPSLLTSPDRSLLTVFLISLFLSIADFLYFYALSLPSALISVVSMIRRGSVLVSFSLGALLFHEKNLRAKALDLALVLLGLFFLWLGSR